MSRTAVPAHSARRGRRSLLAWPRRKTMAGWLLGWAALSLGPVLELRWWPPSTTSFMLRADAQAWWNDQPGARARYSWVEWQDLSPHLALAVIAAEDQRFLQHVGFDFRALQFAWKYNQAHRRLHGGSTITQQTAKNLFLYPDRSYLRKGLEAYFTALLELFWTKRRILETYLNIAQFGDGIFGAEAASRHYFRKAAADLMPNEAALLASVLPNPLRLRVDRPSRFVKARQDWILRQMKQLGGAAYLRPLR